MRHLLFLFFFGGALSAGAQIGAFGLRAGYAQFQQRFAVSGASVSYDHRSGGAGSLYYRAEINPYLSLQPELGYVQKGTKLVSADGFTAVTVDPNGGSTVVQTDIIYRSRMSYLEVPLLVMGHYGKDRWRAYVQTGPTLGYLLSASESLEAGGTTETERADWGEDAQLNRGELGWTVGLGGRLAIGDYYLVLDARHGRSLSNLLNADAPDEDLLFGDDVKATNRGWILSVGAEWLFGN